MTTLDSRPLPDKAIEEVARLVEESSLGTVGAQLLRDRAVIVTVAKIRARAYFNGSHADRSWWAANQHDPEELLRKARELADAGETAASSVLTRVASGLLPDTVQGPWSGGEQDPQPQTPEVHGEALADWRTFEAFYHREIDLLTRILCERADLTPGLGRKLIGQAMTRAFDEWEHLAASGDPGEWVIGCALQLHKSRQLPADDSSWEPTDRARLINLGPLSSPAPPCAHARVAGALAVAASKVPDTSPADSAPESIPAEWDATQAVTEIYSTHYRSLVRLAVLLVRDVATAEEVVHDSFIAMHSSWRQLRASDKALSWLRQSVVNRCRSVLRHRVVVDRNAPKPAPDMPSAQQGALSLLERSAVISALRTLPPRQREALVLKYYADLSEEQIAATMGISQGAVKSHTARAMSALRQVLEVG
jgi:RNA polymerase sigma-70 factor (sigma-E family)